MYCPWCSPHVFKHVFESKSPQRDRFIEQSYRYCPEIQRRSLWYNRYRSYVLPCQSFKGHWLFEIFVAWKTECLYRWNTLCVCISSIKLTCPNYENWALKRTVTYNRSCARTILSGWLSRFFPRFRRSN